MAGFGLVFAGSRGATGIRLRSREGSAESLSMSPFPAILVDGEFPLDPDELPEQEGGDLTFAVRIECTTCGHLMLFNAQRYRTGDARIIEDGITEEERPLRNPAFIPVRQGGTTTPHQTWHKIVHAGDNSKKHLIMVTSPACRIGRTAALPGGRGELAAPAG